MKSLILWLCMAALIPGQLVCANSGFNLYREGNYYEAGKELSSHSKQDPVADYYLGRMNLYGYGVLKNNNQAIEYFKQSALKGYLPAQQFMALYSLYKLDNPTEALVWFKKAADANDVSAQMYCAAAYRYGYGTKKNEDMAKRFYIQAAKNGNSIAQYSLAESFLDTRQAANKQLGLIWLNKSVAQGNPVAQTMLADYYFKGNLLSHDLTKAKELLSLSMAQNYLPARYKMGELAEQEKDYVQAKDCYTDAANKGYLAAEMALSLLYLNPNTPFHDEHSGFLWMLKAAQNGFIPAQRELSAMYKEGRVVSKDEDLATSWQQQAQLASKNHKEDFEKDEVIAWLSNNTQSTLAASGYQLAGILSNWTNKNALKENNYNPAPQMASITQQDVFKPHFEMVDPNDISLAEYHDAILAASAKPSGVQTISFPDYPISTLLLDEIRINQGFDYLATLSSPAKKTNLVQTLKRQAVLGDADAQFNLGQLYQQGMGVKKNPALALHYYELAAAQQDLRAEYMLAKEQFTNQQPIEAIHGFTRAAFKGEPMSQYVLAQLNTYGYKTDKDEVLIKPNQDQARALYSLAAVNQFAPAQYELAELISRQPSSDWSVASRKKQNQLLTSLYQGAAFGGMAQAEVPLAFFNAMNANQNVRLKAFKVAQEKAEEGSPEAALLLGLMYDRGIATEPNHAMALSNYQKAKHLPVGAFLVGTDLIKNQGQTTPDAMALLETAANGGFSYADLNLAVMQQRQNQPFLASLTKAIESGNSQATLLLADYYVSSKGNLEQTKQARAMLQSLANKGHREAQLKLGYLLEQGIGGSQDKANSERWYRLAAEQHQPQAQYLLARTYQLGFMDKQPDYVEAKKWYQLAQKSYVPATIAVGFIDETVDDNYLAAAENYKRAAVMDESIAQFNLGLINEQGKGKPVNFELARELYSKAANQGHNQAKVQLAGLYLNGLGGPKDATYARSLLQEAAKQGDGNALYQLGVLAQTGVAGEINQAEALSYYQQASNQGNAKAAEALMALQKQGGVEMARD